MQLESFLEESARRFPGKTALIFGRQRITYKEIETCSNRLAHAMVERGLRRGDRVAIWLENSPELVIALFAVLKAGAVFLVLNSTTKAEKIEYVLNNCSARALVTDRHHARTFHAHWSTVPHLEMAWIAGELETIDAQSTGKSLASLWQDFENQASPPSPPEKRAIDVDLAALIYTSGSAGVSKGVMMTRHNQRNSVPLTLSIANQVDDVHAFEFELRSNTFQFSPGHDAGAVFLSQHSA